MILALQETWLYNIPKSFRKEFENQYYIIHETAMKKNAARKKGRPYGGIAFIISKAIPFKIKYKHNRCLSILLTKESLLVNNIYLPANDSRFTADFNREKLMEALGHFDAVHESSRETLDCITLGDFNFHHNKENSRTRLIKESLNAKSYNINSDLQFLSSSSYTHKDGHILDRILHTTRLNNSFESVNVNLKHFDSDHFPLTATFNTKNEILEETPIKNTYLCWQKASEKALRSFSNLCDKMCKKSLNKFHHNEINCAELYKEVVKNITEAANTCIPKTDPTKRKRHDIPQWKEKMATYQNEVDYWVTMQQLHGGPRRCSEFVNVQLRRAKSAYRRQIRHLRREVQVNIAESTTVKNCHKHLFGKTKTPAPALIDGFSRHSQPVMWRDHFREVFGANENPYKGGLLSDISAKITAYDKTSFTYLSLSEVNDAISQINTNKSYERHKHWKHMQSHNHTAKLCLVEILNYWIKHILNDDSSNNDDFLDWDFFLTNLNVIPKKGKKDISIKKAWRPISIGTSENWVLEKILLHRLSPFTSTKDAQFGYKRKHGTAHAIELVRVLERSHDAHICLLDASSAFDKLSWRRIKDQLLKRNVPLILVKIVISQLLSTKISVCLTRVMYPRVGVKQGGVLSGILFACCYDDLVDVLERTGVGILFKTLKGHILLCVVVYADDVLLIASSPYGLKILI